MQLETQRLILRQWRLQDVDEYAAICADPEVMRHLSGEPYTRMVAWRHVAFLVGHWELRGFGHWVVEEKESGCVIGRVGFLQPDDYPGFELGWMLARAVWGRGYATEAASRALDYAFDSLGRPEVISLIRPENAASIRVALKLGETYRGIEDVGGVRVAKYGVSREAWQACRSTIAKI